MSALQADRNGQGCSIAPYAYLKMVFTELPKAASIEDVKALLRLKQHQEKMDVA